MKKPPADVTAQGESIGTFDFAVFERATEIMAMWLSSFRSDDEIVTENDRLTAGHLAGALSANGLLAPAADLTRLREVNAAMLVALRRALSSLLNTPSSLGTAKGSDDEVESTKLVYDAIKQAEALK